MNGFNAGFRWQLDHVNGGIAEITGAKLERGVLPVLPDFSDRGK